MHDVPRDLLQSYQAQATQVRDQRLTMIDILAARAGIIQTLGLRKAAGRGATAAHAADGAADAAAGPPPADDHGHMTGELHADNHGCMSQPEARPPLQSREHARLLVDLRPMTGGALKYVTHYLRARFYCSTRLRSTLEASRATSMSFPPRRRRAPSRSSCIPSGASTWTSLRRPTWLPAAA